MNPKFEKILAIVAILVFSGVTSISSLTTASDGVSGGFSGGTSIFERVSGLIRYGIYGFTIFAIVARFKKVVRPAFRDPFLWGLMGIVVTSFLWSDLPSVSQKNGLITLITTLYGLYFASRYSIKEQVEILGWAFGIAAVFSFFYTIALPQYGLEQGVHAGAWRGPLLHKNMFARFMDVCAPLLLIVALKAKRRKYLIWGIFTIAAATVILSKSSTGLIIFITLVILIPIYKALQWSSSITIPFVMVSVLGIGSGLTWLANNWEPFINSLGKDATLTGRTEIWQFVLDKIHLRPWFGYGYEAFWTVHGDGIHKYGLMLKLAQAHNGYLDLTVHLGLVGVVLFILSVLTAYIKAINLARFSREIEDLWPIIYVTFLFFYNQTESTIVETNSLYWILFVTVTFSLKFIPAVKPQTFVETIEQPRLLESA